MLHILAWCAEKEFGQTMTKKTDGYMESKAHFFVTRNVLLVMLTVYRL